MTALDLSIYPRLYDREENFICILDKAFSVIIEDQLQTDTNGAETLTFSIPLDNPKASLLDNEMHIKVGASEFAIRILQNGWDSGQGIPTLDVTCEAIWYDLAEYDPINSMNYQDTGPKTVMEAILQGTDFSVGTVEITTPQDFSITDPTNPLAALQQLPSVYGGELQFDSINRKVNLVNHVGTDRGFLAAYGKNIKADARIVDTRNLVTRIYPYGANNLSIAGVNNGLEYLENYQWYDLTGKPRQVKTLVVQTDQITNPSYLKQWGDMQLDTLSMPKISYTLDVITGKDMPNLGDIITIYDPLLKLNVKERVAQRSYHVTEPWDSSMQVDSALYTLADQLMSMTGNGIASDVSALEQQTQDMVPFNELLNSRADGGLAYWQADGWTVDNTVGASGQASFSCEGALGETKTLSQTINPANRDNYTVSAQVELDNIKKGPNGKIGFNIMITYEDGTQETQFIAIA